MKGTGTTPTPVPRKEITQRERRKDEFDDSVFLLNSTATI